MLQANNCKLLRGWGVAKPLDRLAEHRIIGRRQTSRNTLQQFLSPSVLIAVHRRLPGQLTIGAAGCVNFSIQGSLSKPLFFLPSGLGWARRVNIPSLQGAMLAARHPASL
jgi:hypothetical protein